MPVDFVWRIDGIDWIIADFGQKFAATARRMSLGIGEIGKNTIAKYPGPANSPVRWSSEKQRRFYFAMRRKAGLSPQYARISDPMSQRLGQHWEVEPEGTTDAVLGNTTPYGKWVHTAKDQWSQHTATGWTTDEQVVDALGRNLDIGRLVEVEVRDFFRHAN